MKKILLGFSLLFSLNLAWVVPVGLVQADSGITFGPYVQRVSETGASIFIRTDEAKILTLNYRKVGAETWKTKVDSNAKTTHRFRLTSLKQGKEYEYFIANANGDHITLTYTFQAEKDVTNDDPLRVAVVGDFGAFTTDELRIVTQMMWWQPDIILTTGDNAYESGTLDEYAVNVFKPYQPLLAEVPMYASMGNHDYTTDEGGPMKEVFELPTSSSGTEDYYSFNYDNIHFVAVNSNLDYSVGSDQYTWLQEDLETADQRWKLIYFHHPVFSSGEHGSTAGMDSILAPLFSANDVDLVLNGHDHDYERNSKVNGVLYLVTGGGGKSLYDQVNENEYSQVFLSEYHFVGLTIQNDELKLKAIDKRGYAFDEKKLRKD